VSGASGLRKHGHTSAGDGGTITVPGGDAVDVVYDPTASGLTATDVQAAIDELDTTVDGLGGAGVEIDDDAANIQGVNFEDQVGDPSAPAAGHTIVYTKAGELYFEDDAAVVTGPLGAGGGGAPTTADYLVGTTQGGLSAEIVVGTTPGGELGNTWASPTVDGTHSGSAHTDFIAKAIVDAKGDIIAATAADTVARVAVGADGLFLKADSGATAGVSWASATGSGAVATDAIFDAKGDLPVGTGADTAAKLTVGTNGYVLTADSGETTGLKWAAGGGAASGAKVYNNGTQSVSSGAETIITFGGEEYDTDAIHSTGSNTGRMTAHASGKWRFKAVCPIAANATGSRAAGFRKNGSGYMRGGYAYGVATSANPTAILLVMDCQLTAGDYVETFVYQNSGSSLNVGDVDANDYNQAVFEAEYLGS
jgi:hypothetical protein